MLKYLSGVNESDAALNGWFQDALNKVRSGFQNVVKNIQNFSANLPKITLPNINLSNFSNKLKKVGVAPARAAFLTLVRFNVTKMADRLADAYRLKPVTIKDMWVKGYGGNFEQLKKAINQGTRGAKINGRLGVVKPEVVIGLIAAALPVLAGVIAIVKNIRGNRDAADSMADQSTINDMANFIDSNPPDVVNQQATGGGTGINQQTLLIAGGAAVAIFLLTRKK